MTNKNSEKEWMDDFKDFMESDGSPVPAELSKNILSRIEKALNPSAWIVFAKLTAIHSILGTLSLAICNQFGMNPFNTTYSLMNYFMQFGHSVCMTLCGFIFIGLSISLGFFILNSDEVRIFKNNSLIQIFSLSMISLAAFFAFGAELVLSIAVLWTAGALVGGLTPVVISNLKIFRST
jgi:hypothetical protein